MQSAVLKIEGRARGAEYVKRVVECYDQALKAMESGTYTPALTAELKERLRTVFNRGFWEGYYAGRPVVEHSPAYGSSATQRKVYAPLACVLCDESQFFTAQQAEQLFMVTVDLNIPVICYGLRADFSLKGFPGSTRLLELAHTIEEMKTICTCGRKAICNCRRVNGRFVFEGEQVAIDLENDVQYVSMCPQCYFKAKRAFYAEKAASRVE